MSPAGIAPLPPEYEYLLEGIVKRDAPLERYRKFEEDEFLLTDAPHVGEDPEEMA